MLRCKRGSAGVGENPGFTLRKRSKTQYLMSEAVLNSAQKTGAGGQSLCSSRDENAAMADAEICEGASADEVSRRIERQEDDTIQTPAGLNIHKSELVRIMSQAMMELGYVESASMLQREAHVDMEARPIQLFREAVLRGDWQEVESLLEPLQYQNAEALEVPS